MRNVTFTWLAVFSLVLVTGAGIAQAEDIQGTIVVTKLIFEDSQLTGDVTCEVVGAPCIQFGADDIALKLNGFTMTGKANPDVGCGGTSIGNESGIDTNFRHSVEVEGPGLVQQFRFSGIHVIGSTKAKVKRVTISTNCFAGMSLFGSSDNDIEENIGVKNGNFNNGCGGIELVGLLVDGVLVGSNNNRVKENLFSGNGYSNPSENVAVGNPPIQVSNSFPATAALRADIRNQSPAGANTFEKNYCLTSIGPDVACPNVNFPE